MREVSDEILKKLIDGGIGYKKIKENVRIERAWSSYNIDNSIMNAFYFDSYADLVDKCYYMYQNHNWKPYRYENNNQWYFGTLRTYEKSVDALINGKATDRQVETAQKIYNQISKSPFVLQLEQRAQSIKKKRVFSEDGAELDIDRVMCGDPMHWTRLTKGAQKPVVRIGANINGNAGEGEQRFIGVAAAAAVISDLVSRAGFSVEVYSCSTSQTDGARCYASLCCKIKQAEQPLDINRICSAGLPIILRHFSFTVRGNSLERDGGLFSSTSIPKEFANELEFDHIIDADELLNRDYTQMKEDKLNDIFNKLTNYVGII